MSYTTVAREIEESVISDLHAVFPTIVLTSIWSGGNDPSFGADFREDLFVPEVLSGCKRDGKAAWGISSRCGRKPAHRCGQDG